MIDFSDIPKYPKKVWEYDAQQMRLVHDGLKISFQLKSIRHVGALVSLIIQYKSSLPMREYTELLRILNLTCENIIGQDLKSILNLSLDTKLYWGDEFSAFQQNEDSELCKSR